MSKYSSLEKFLLSSNQDCIKMKFSDIENILGFALPQSAYSYEAWWANGSHSQAYTWLNAGYKTERANVKELTICFCKREIKPIKQSRIREKSKKEVHDTFGKTMEVDSTSKKSLVCGYEFVYLQELVPECDEFGKIKNYYPQNNYDNKDNLTLTNYGKGAFCQFSINAGSWPGVYVWVVDEAIIYIGETENLQKRFNMGYGRISPRNCYVGGQSTNCKMNKVVLNLFEQGKFISLYFYKTIDYKQVEIELLSKINTMYNTKNNRD